MIVSEIARRLTDVISDLSELRDSGELSEEDTKRKIIEPFFESFGWDFSHYGEIMIKMESKLTTDSQKDKADYIFKLRDASILILEAKPLSFELTDKDRDQLRRYMRLDECRFGAISNGEIYEFFKRVERDIELFYRLDLSKLDEFDEENVRDLFWLYKDSWELWLELGPSELERTINLLTSLNRTKPREVIVKPAKVVIATPHSVTAGKAPRGAATSQKTFEAVTLDILRERNGLTGSEIVAKMAQIFADRLNNWDLAKVSSGEIRWKNRVWFGFQNLKDTGKIRLEQGKYYIN